MQCLSHRGGGGIRGPFVLKKMLAYGYTYDILILGMEIPGILKMSIRFCRGKEQLMKLKKFSTNDLYADHKLQKEIRDALNEGYAVSVGTSCIGHTRAEMVEYQKKEFLTGCGAHLIRVGEWGSEYYTL